MAGYPADICCAEMDIPRLELKNIYKSIVCPNHITAACMYNTFRLTGASRSIQDKEHALRTHAFSLAICLSLLFSNFHFILPPHVPVMDHTNRHLGMCENNYSFYRRTGCKCIID